MRILAIGTIVGLTLSLTGVALAGGPVQVSWSPKCPKNQKLVCTTNSQKKCTGNYACKHAQKPNCGRDTRLIVRAGADWCQKIQNGKIKKSYPSKCPKGNTRITNQHKETADSCVIFRPPHFVISEKKTIISKFKTAKW